MNTHDPLAQAAFICSVGEKTRNHFWGNFSRKRGARTAARLTAARLHLLEIVASQTCITITELARQMDVSTPSASAMVNRLVSCGWLQRERSRRDRRKVQVSVSPEVKQKISDLQKIVHREILDLIATIGPETTQKWCDVLKEIKRADRRPEK